MPEETDDNSAAKEHKGVIRREYIVFNAGQVVGIAMPEPEELQTATPPQDTEDISRALQNMPNPPAVSWGHNQAMYRPAADVIAMPYPKRFYSDHGFLATFWHELAHAIGHRSRLDRWRDHLDLGPTLHEYAAEELVAEITAAMMLARYNIPPDADVNAAAYVANWRQHLKNHPGHLITAAQQAQKAYNLITAGLEPAENVC